MSPLYFYYGLFLFSVLGSLYLLARKVFMTYYSRKKQLKMALEKVKEQADNFSSVVEKPVEKTVENHCAEEVQKQAPRTPSPEIQKEVSRLLKKADTFLGQKEVKEAEKILIQTLAYDDKNKDALHRISEVYLSLESYPRAVFFLDQYFDHHDTTAATSSNYAMAHFYMKDFEKAISYYSKAVDMQPDNPVRYANLGQVFYVLENYSDSVKCYIEALKLDPRNVEYHEMVAEGFRLDNSFPEAKKWYEKILTLSPYHPKAQKEIEKLVALGF